MMDNIVMYRADVIEHLAGCSLKHIRPTLTLVAIWIDHHLDTFGYNIDIDVRTCQCRLAIEVDRSLFGTMNVQVSRAEGLDTRALVQSLAEHVDGNLRCLKDIERFHDNYIHQAITHAGLWGDISIVAILRGVGTGDKERFVGRSVLIGAQLIGLRLILQT